MTSEAVSGTNAAFRRLADSVFEEIGEITNISGPSMSKDTIDVTSMDSDGWKEFIASLKDAGEVSLEMNFTRETFDTVYADYLSDDLQAYEILVNDDEGTTINFDGLVTSVGLEIPVGDKVGSSVTIKVSGAPNINSGSGSS